MGGYVQISRIVGILWKMAIKIWAYTGLVTVSCFLVYYLYGGIFAFAILLFSALGKMSSRFLHAQASYVYISIA